MSLPDSPADEQSDETHLLERRAADVRMRLMHAMDALGRRRHQLAVTSHEVLERGARYASLAGVAAVAAAGLAAGVATWVAIARTRRRAAARIFDRMPRLSWRRPEPPARAEPSLFARLALRLLAGLATVVVKAAVKRLALAQLGAGDAAERESEDSAGRGRETEATAQAARERGPARHQDDHEIPIEVQAVTPAYGTAGLKPRK